MKRGVIVAGVAIIIAAVAILAIMSGGKGGGTETGTMGGVVLHGSGATFPAAQYMRWFADFKRETGISVEYRLVGSGQGIQDFLNGLVDFAGSDPPLPHDFYVKAVKRYGGVLQVPAIAGAIVVVYNLPGIPSNIHLNLTGEVLALIYMGVIKYWDDPRIQRLNPGVKLPHKQIRPVYRADSSGTTQYFTYYLYLSSKEWRDKYGYGKVWPIQGVGIGAQGNPGVASTVKNTPYSIGYVEWAYAIKEGLAIAALSPPGRSDVFLLPSEESAMKTLEAVADKLPRPDADWSNTFGLTVKVSSEAGGYPLVAYTHLIFRKSYESSVKCEAVKKLLEWLYKANVEKIDIVQGYVPLPQKLASKLLEASKMVCTS